MNQMAELNNDEDGCPDSVKTANATNLSSDTISEVLSEAGGIEKDSTVVCAKWTKFTTMLHSIIGRFVVALSMCAARNPIICIVSVIGMSLALVTVGFMTNFEVNVEEEEIYAPFNSVPQEHLHWTMKESGFNETTRPVTLILHNNGANVLDVEAMRKVFQALDTVRNTTGYAENCEDGDTWDEVKEEFTCRVVSATRAWYHDYALFDSQINSDQDLIDALSATEYPGGSPVDHEYIMGTLTKEESGTITYVPAYFVYLLLTNQNEETEELELRITERLFALQDEWAKDIGTSRELHLDFFTDRTMSDEFKRAIEDDMYLVVVVFFMMSGFTCLVFFKSDSVQSRCMLGVGSVTTIGMSLFSGFGLMFIFGVPFTSMTQLLPFLVFGVGLDDTFIITGAFLRTDPSLEPEARVRLTMEEVGPSISVTTITTMTAFLLGLLSTVPAIYWLCLYAFPTIFLDFIYQITLFIAILVLDERRVRANRKDCCRCCTTYKDEDDGESDENQGGQNSKHIADRVMAWYGEQLLRPCTKVVVLVVFVGFLALCGYRASLLTQEFDVKELFPEGSYATSALIAMDEYNEKTIPFSITFRDVNQSDPLVQQQMITFMEEIAELPAFGEEPPFCWVRDFEALKEMEMYDAVANLTFKEKVDFALSNPSLKEVYGDDIVLEEGNIVASRCTILAKNSYLEEVDGLIELLLGQRAVTDDQQINQGRPREAFFTYSSLYLIWEFYSIAVDELILTTVLSISAATIVAFIFIPHWSAVLFILPLMCVVYVDLMGVLQMAGLHINAVTYVCLVISIGLIVDFLMHMLLRYNESTMTSREGKVKDTLETMGASILLGGLSTFLGALPLAFSTSVIIRTVFTSFCSMVVLGVSHGLILLPVLLSVVGPIPPENRHPHINQAKDENTRYFSDSSSDDSPRKIAPVDSALSIFDAQNLSVEGERHDPVEHVLQAVAEQKAKDAFPDDDAAAQKEESELVNFYSSIYAQTSDPEAFLLQLLNEVNTKKDSLVVDSC